MVTIKSKKEIELMREACKLTAEVHEEIAKNIRPGISTYELDQIAENYMRAHGGIPAEKNFPSGMPGVPDFPASICASVNDEIIHGIPSKNVILQEGDVISIDLVVLKNGFNGDAARTYIVGKPNNEEDVRLVEVTKQAFYEGLKYAKKGCRVGDISNAVYEYVTSQGFSILREFQGHGIGREMHEEPGVPNWGKPGRGMRLEPGMTICIEPMVFAGDRHILELDDGWTIVSEDGSNGAHYENTILITENEPEILTKT